MYIFFIEIIINIKFFITNGTKSSFRPDINLIEEVKQIVAIFRFFLAKC